MQMQRLERVYGDKNYPQERLDLFWREFKNLDNDIFQEIVNELIATSRMAPMLSELREKKSEVSKKYDYRIKAARDAFIASLKDCFKCGKLGYITATKNDSKGIYSFLCDCGIGERLSLKYPKWNYEFDKLFTPHFHSQDHQVIPIKQTNFNYQIKRVSSSMPEPTEDDYNDPRTGKRWEP